MKKPLFSTITDEDWKRAIEAARHRRSLMPYRIREALSRADKKLTKHTDKPTETPTDSETKTQ